MALSVSAPFDPESYLSRYAGGLPRDEWLALARHAASCPPGAIVEIGSLRGRSAVALAYGVTQDAAGDRKTVHCVEPHEAFVGLYGGVFGPKDRVGFYKTMLETGFADQVALINLKSAQAAQAWDAAIGMLFIDGDHTLEGVSADVRGWERHLVIGGTLAFDDAKDEAAGPIHVIRRLLDTGSFAHIEDVGRMVFLRKTAVLDLDLQDLDAFRL